MLIVFGIFNRTYFGEEVPLTFYFDVKRLSVDVNLFYTDTLIQHAEESRLLPIANLSHWH